MNILRTALMLVVTLQPLQGWGQAIESELTYRCEGFRAPTRQNELELVTSMIIPGAKPFLVLGKDLVAVRTQKLAEAALIADAENKKHFSRSFRCPTVDNPASDADAQSCVNALGKSNLCSTRSQSTPLPLTEADVDACIQQTCPVGESLGDGACVFSMPNIAPKFYFYTRVGAPTVTCIGISDSDHDLVSDDADQCDGVPNAVQNENVFDEFYPDESKRGCSKDDCPELASHEGRRQIFESGFQRPIRLFDGAALSVKFAPICPSSREPVALKRLATAMGFDHFNWHQLVHFPESAVYALRPENFQGSQNYPASVASLLGEQNVDPAFDGSHRLVSAVDGQGSRQAFSIPNFVMDGAGNKVEFDGHPYYYNEGAELASQTSKYELVFSDAPSAPAGWFAKDAGVSAFERKKSEFLLSLAAVRSDSTYLLWSTKFFWTSTKEAAATPTFEASFQGAAPFTPAGYEEWPGVNKIEAILDANRFPVPPLVGRDPTQEGVMNEYLMGSGFNVEVVRSEASTIFAAGSVISQDPQEWTQVKAAGAIKVVLSTGLPKSCGAVPSGGTTTRHLYRSSLVPFGSSCDSVKEMQTGTCTDGVMTFSGTAQFESCSIAPKPSLCVKTAKKLCKAGLLQIENCEMPKNIVSIRKDAKYKGSQCLEAPSTLTIFNFLKFINSYSVKNGKVTVQLGCNIQFDVSYTETCSN